MSKDMTPAQRAYEERRAKKAGVSLDKWLAQKERERTVAPPPPPAAPKKPGFFSRLLDKAHKPL